MTDLIDRDALIKALNELAMEHHESHVPLVEHDFRELIRKAKHADINEALEQYCVCGYEFKELAIFADACREQGITERDMADFCRNITSAWNYIAKEVEKQLDDAILNGWSNGGRQ